jgi:hypothetical protein
MVKKYECNRQGVSVHDDQRRFNEDRKMSLSLLEAQMEDRNRLWNFIDKCYDFRF